MPADLELLTDHPEPGLLPLVGRDAELGQLRRALARAVAGEATLVLVTGEAGIGKSALLRGFVSGEGTRVVRLEADCDESERELEYGVVRQIAAAAGGSLPRAPGPVPEPFQVGAALLELVGSLADRGAPVVVVVDDVQWADEVSLDALTFMARRLRADRVLLCLATRPDGVRRLPQGIVRRIEETGGRIDLEGLGRNAVAALAGREYDVALDPRTAERLRAHTTGNPLHLRALLETVPARLLKQADPLPVPSSYAALVGRQVASCSPDARELLAALVVLGQDAGLGDAAAVAGVDEPLGPAEELARHGLVVLAQSETGTGLACRHGLVRASVLDQLPLSHRARLHARAAEVLSGHDALRHRLSAATTPSPGLVSAARAEADALVARGALTPAARLLAGAARLLGAGEEREQLVLSAAMLLLDAGAPVSALVGEIEGYAPSAARDFVLGRLAFHRADLTAATELLTRAWSTAPATSGLATSVADMLAILATALGRYDELATWSRRAVAGGQGSLNSAAMLFYGVSLDADLATAERELTALVDERRGDDVGLGARLARGMCLLARNELERAEADLTTASLAPQVQGSIQAYVNARSFLAECHFRQGSWERALDLAVSTTSIVDDAGARWMAALPHTVAAVVLAGQGDLDAARAHADQARETAEELGMVQAILWAGVATMRVAEAAGDHARVAEVGDALVAAGTAGLPDWIQRRRATYVEALAAVGRTADAERQLAALEDEVRADDNASLAAEAARARGALRLAEGDRVGALDALEAGLALEETRTGPFERARLELASGAVRRRAGERRAAAALLESAAATFRNLGARPWLERCERELAACGLSPVKRSAPDAREELTPQERLVANLAAAGLTNREIASELVLSAKTVEFHLSRIYRKLGVRSRSHLAARLAAQA